MSRSQAEEIERLLREGPLDLGGDLEVQRPMLDGLMTSHPLAPDVHTAEQMIGGVPAVEVLTAGADRSRVLLYLHGGAYAMGSASASAGLVAELTRRVRVRGLAVEYRLAPEHPFPAALQDAIAAYRGLLESGVPAERVVIAGESAGGGLALALLASLDAAGLPQPAAAAVFSPWADLTMSGASLSTKASLDPVLTRSGLQVRAADYLAGIDPRDPLASPVNADLRGLPPLLIQAGSHEVLLDDAVAVAAAAAAADVAVTLDITPAMPHVFQGFAAVLDEGAAALDRAAAFLEARLAPASATTTTTTD